MVGGTSDGRGTSVDGGCWLNTPGVYGDRGTTYCPWYDTGVVGWTNRRLSTNAFCISSICCVRFASASFNCDTLAKDGTDPVDSSPPAVDTGTGLATAFAYLSLLRLCSSITGSLCPPPPTNSPMPLNSRQCKEHPPWSTRTCPKCVHANFDHPEPSGMRLCPLR